MRGELIFDCLKREGDICVKTTITSQNTAFWCIPAVTLTFRLLALVKRKGGLSLAYSFPCFTSKSSIRFQN